ncbi:uncharacterized protein LOC144576062 [Carex rostrata]
MSDSTTSKMIKLQSCTGKEFEVSETVLVEQSQNICRSIETAFTENSIPQANVNVTAPILEKVFEYCMKHIEAADASKTETTGKGFIKDDDFTAEKEECASIISGLKLSTEEKDSTASKMIELKSNDGEEFEVSETVLVKQSQTICCLIEDAFTENIPRVNVNITTPILEKVFEYCMKHIEAADASKTETTSKGRIKDDDFTAKKEECASIISGLNLSTEEKDSTASKTIKLKSNDGKEFEVSETVAQQSQTICRLIEEASSENSIPLVNVTALILEKVIKYCTKHVDTVDASKTEKTGKDWDKQFVNDIDKAAMLFDLIMAANYLNVDGLLDVTCQKMADNVMGKSTEKIRQAFNIKDDDQKECDSIISGLTGFDEKKKKRKRKNKKK